MDEGPADVDCASQAVRGGGEGMEQADVDGTSLSMGVEGTEHADVDGEAAEATDVGGSEDRAEESEETTPPEI